MLSCILNQGKKQQGRNPLSLYVSFDRKIYVHVAVKTQPHQVNITVDMLYFFLEAHLTLLVLFFIKHVPQQLGELHNTVTRFLSFFTHRQRIDIIQCIE